ncbi:MAG: quinoprotein dehydrogenase-associated putative ABC transporter substrate-binding protein, partial [Alphaproteobacteria bacterium]|nr:quinoprotein dehydrogenase-associated putative ABC transporter substrate-binding protein [Alphaproteobacteria bacterium]
MPLSNAAGEGFENKLAALVAGELGKRLVYTWAPQDDNFVHETLSAHRCDVIIGVPR